MEYESLLSGSPLIPSELFIAYGIAVTVVFLVVTLLAKKNLGKVLFFSQLIFHGILITVFTTFALIILGPVPNAVKTNFKMSENPDNPAIEITFNKPLMRKYLDKSISPYTPGIWLFEDPVYGTHLYRKIVFYPYKKLNPGTTYTVFLSGIRNFLNPVSETFTYSIKTTDVFDVLGDATNVSANNDLMIVGSFPASGWDGISTDTSIRIRFNRQVYTQSAESRFSISPPVEGTFIWEGETMIFTPKTYFDFSSRYSFTVASGVEDLSGRKLKNSYQASFSTQEKTTKLNVPFFLQKYSLSCEAAALRMALAFRGINATEDELLLKIGFDPNGKRGNTWGNPYVGFVGNVKGKQMKNGYGVYWEPIAQAANNYRYSKSFENWTIKQLTQSIQKSTPIIAWISINGRPPTVWTTPTGDSIKAVADEHTVVVTGFSGPPSNPSEIIINDPLIGEAYLSRESFEKKWGSLSNSGVTVY